MLRGAIEDLARQEEESAKFGRAIDLKISAVEREDASDLVPLSHSHERRVGKIHR